MIKFEFKQFPTHVKLSSKKYVKINSQAIYNARLHPFSRSKMIKEMKDQFIKCIPEGLKVEDLPIGMFLELHLPYNYGNVRMSKGVVKWLPMSDEENYEPRNDLDNMIGVWSKAIQDCLVTQSVIPEDTIQFVRILGYKYIQCETLDDRKIVVSLIPISNITDILEVVTSAGILKLEDLEVLNSLLKF